MGERRNHLGPMRFVSFQRDGRTRVGALAAGGVVDLSGIAESIPDLIARYVDLAVPLAAALADGPVLPLDGLALQSPIAQAGKLVCVMRNRPTGDDDAPPFGYLKSVGNGVGAGATVRLPPGDAACFYEPEVAAVLKGPVRDIEPERWRDAVFGFTLLLDIARPPVEFPPGVTRENWTKSFDTAYAAGPWIVTADEVAVPGHGLAIEATGAERTASAADPGHPALGKMIAFLTSVMTFHAGDVITLGAHEDTLVAAAPGDTVTASLQDVGALSMQVAA